MIIVEVYDLVKKKQEEGTISDVLSKYKDMLSKYNVIIARNKIVFIAKELERGCNVHQALKLLRSILDAKDYIDAILEKLEAIKELINELEENIEVWLE